MNRYIYIEDNSLWNNYRNNRYYYRAITIGIIGKPKTIILGCNGKIEEDGESLEFMKKLNEYRLKYLGRI
ncbi:MAG: hypothetical protein ACO2OT_03020 [Candidatus Caldipriscus sp.]